MTREETGRGRRFALLALLLCVFAAGKVAFDPPLGRSQDGDYYFQIARNVAEGHGLATNVSLYFQGLPHFPHPVNQNPLWLLALGHAGRAFGLREAAALLPELLYLLDLVLLYALARRLWPEAQSVWPLARSGVDVGHLAVALFGSNALFFRFTSLPYTEGLAFAFLLGGLLATHRAATERSIPWAAFAGALGALALLTRAQMLGAVAAGPAALAIAGWRDRRLLRLAAVSGASAGLVLLPWAVFVVVVIGSASPMSVLGLATIHATPELAPLRAAVDTRSLWGDLVDRAGGLVVAFSPRDPDGYVASFGWAAYLAPLAALRIAIEPTRWRTGARTLATPEHVALLAALLAAGALLAPIHVLHLSGFQHSWLFSWRHGLPYVLLVVASLGFLLVHGGRALRLASLGLVAASLVSGGLALRDELTRSHPPDLLGSETRLLAWLENQSPRASLVTTQAARLAVFDRSGFHWIRCGDTPEHTRAMLRHAGADYVLVYGREERCRFVEDLRGELEPVRSFGRGRDRVSLFALRE